MLTAARQRLSRGAAAWVVRRQGIDPNPVTLGRQRVYILPTRQGSLFALALLAMLLTSLNYDNNLGLMLTFLLGGLAITAMYRCQRNLAGLVVHVHPPAPVFCGEEQRYPVLLSQRGRQCRYAIDGAGESVKVAPGSSACIVLTQPTPRRGRYKLRRFSLRTTYPLGLFRAWVWVHADVAGLVYPAPVEPAAPPASAPAEDDGSTGQGRDGDDFAGVRAFQTGDPMQHVDWRAYARGHGMLTKQFSTASPAVAHYDLAALAGVPLETALSRLARSIVDAARDETLYSLRLNQQSYGPASGAAHRDRCLAALALYGKR